jgi:hypothetical protein
MVKDTTQLAIEDAVIKLANEHAETWQDKPDSYWLARLLQEVGELGSALVDDHDDPVEWELLQVASIAINFARKRRAEL